MAQERTLAVFAYEGTGDLVVLLHPGNMDHRCWDGVTASMPSIERRPRLVAYDRRGYGASPSQAEVDEVKDLKSVIDDLQAERVFLVGNSAGAGVACQFALDSPHRVAGLLLLAPAVPGAPTPDLATVPARERQLLEQALRTADPEAGAAAEVRLWLDGAAANDGRVTAVARRRTYELILDQRRWGRVEDADDPLSDTWDRLGDIACPTRIVAGGLDLGFIVENANRMTARIGGARCETWPDAAHLLPLEHPGRVASAIRDLVAGA
jgi:pimeloyl-ACP methyl ester carboxylesterase